MSSIADDRRYSSRVRLTPLWRIILSRLVSRYTNRVRLTPLWRITLTARVTLLQLCSPDSFTTHFAHGWCHRDTVTGRSRWVTACGARLRGCRGRVTCLLWRTDGRTDGRTDESHPGAARHAEIWCRLGDAEVSVWASCVSGHVMNVPAARTWNMVQRTHLIPDGMWQKAAERFRIWTLGSRLTWVSYLLPCLSQAHSIKLFECWKSLQADLTKPINWQGIAPKETNYKHTQ